MKHITDKQISDTLDRLGAKPGRQVELIRTDDDWVVVILDPARWNNGSRVRKAVVLRSDGASTDQLWGYNIPEVDHA